MVLHIQGVVGGGEEFGGCGEVGHGFIQINWICVKQERNLWGISGFNLASWKPDPIGNIGFTDLVILDILKSEYNQVF